VGQNRPSDLSDFANFNNMRAFQQQARSNFPRPSSQPRRQHPSGVDLLSAGELLSSLLQPSAAAQTQTDGPLAALQMQVRTVVRGVWADSTWTNRINLHRRFQEFISKHGLEDLHETLDWSIALFVQGTEVSAASKLTYAKNLAAMFHRQGFVTPILQLYQSALRASGGMIPTAQSTPAERVHVDRMMLRAQQSQQPRLYAAIFIAYKSASRIDDVLNIIGKSVISNSPSEIILDWADRTKTTRADPFRSSSWVVIVHHAPMTEVSAVLASLEPEESLLPDWSTSTFVRWLQRDPLTEHLKAHSTKRGAMDVLARAVVEGKLDMWLLPLMAKHKTAFDFPSITLRYLADKAQAARMMRTQAATALLLCAPYPAELQVLPALVEPQAEPRTIKERVALRRRLELQAQLPPE
jgi:hypothetical protein